MATAAQIEANRRNARKSTGPRTPEGKSASAMNSIRHGLTAVKIFPIEDQAEFDTLVEDYAARFQPATPDERQRVDTMIHADWNLRRYRRLHEDAWQALRLENPGQTDAQILIADLRGSRILEKLLRYQRDLQRAYDRALAALTRELRYREQARQHTVDAMELEAQHIASATFDSLGGVRMPLAAKPDARDSRPQGIGFVSSPPQMPKPQKASRRKENLALRL